jgi:hypothetical protein
MHHATVPAPLKIDINLKMYQKLNKTLNLIFHFMLNAFKGQSHEKFGEIRVWGIIGHN